jgi:hypothetical protein
MYCYIIYNFVSFKKYIIKFMTFKSLLLFILLSINCFCWKAARRFQFINNCPQTIWVGGMGLPQISRTGWEMAPQTQQDLTIAANTVAIRFWARTGCKWVSGQFRCDTGDCGAPPNNFGI